MFFCFRFGWKLCLLLIQKHARDCFKAFAHSASAANWSCCALIGIWADVWLDSKQTSFPRTGHRFKSAALHRIQFRTYWFQVICSYVLFLLWDQRMLARLSKEMSSALVCNKFSRNPSKLHFPWEKKLLSLPKIYKHLKLLWLSN